MLRKVERVINECIVNKPLSENISDLLEYSIDVMLEQIRKEANEKVDESEAVTSLSRDNVIEKESSCESKIKALNVTIETDGGQENNPVVSKESTKEARAIIEDCKGSLKAEVRH